MKPSQDQPPVNPQRAPASVVARLNYLHASNLAPFSYAYEPPEGVPWESGEYDAVRTSITDARQVDKSFSVDVEGFTLLDAPTEVTDFTDAAQIRVEGLAAANGRIHNDYSEASGRKRLGMVVPDPGMGAHIKRHSIVNVWRSIKGPVLDTPLAICDARTVLPADLVTSEVRYPRRTGEIYALRHSPAHRWFYYSEMDRHEALVFKQFDAMTHGVARFVPHTAFDLPDIPPDTPLRESIELRCLVVYDEDFIS